MSLKLSTLKKATKTDTDESPNDSGQEEDTTSMPAETVILPDNETLFLGEKPVDEENEDLEQMIVDTMDEEQEVAQEEGQEEEEGAQEEGQEEEGAEEEGEEGEEEEGEEEIEEEGEGGEEKHQGNWDERLDLFPDD